MPDVDDINDAIATNAVGPSQVTVGNETVIARSADDQIKAANHLAANEAGSLSHFGLRFTKAIPPGGG